MADQLVCHRVKECCVHLHSCVQKWKELNNKGFDIASKLVNLSLQKKYEEKRCEMYRSVTHTKSDHDMFLSTGTPRNIVTMVS